MIVEKGDKLHIITRRLFDGDLRRHFVGEVEEVSGDLVLLTGFAFIFNPNTNDYVRMPVRRRRIIGLVSSGLVINVMPGEVIIEDLVYRVNRENRLVLTDGAAYSLDINEFGASR
jgi:hypothetical protein